MSAILVRLAGWPAPARLAVGALVSCGAGFGWVESYTQPFSPWRPHAIQGALVAALVALILVALRVGQAGERRRSSVDPLTTAFQEQIELMSRAYRSYSSFEDGGLFRHFFCAQARQLAQEMDAASGRQSLDVTPRGHTTRPLLNSLKGRDNHICKFVHHLDNNKFFFESRHSVDFFWRIYEAVQEGTVAEVRRVFVYPGVGRSGIDAALQDFDTQLLLAFHTDVEKYQWRMVSSETFRLLGKDEDIYDEHLDLGLYGDMYAYLSSQRPAPIDPEDRAQQASGSFVAARSEVARYDEFFELIWRRGRSEVEHALPPCPTPNELFREYDHINLETIETTGVRDGLANSG